MWRKHVVTCVSLSKQLGILVSTCNAIVKNHNIIEENSKQHRPMAKKQNIKKSRFEELEDILKEWFENARSSNLSVSGVVLRVKAMHVAKRLQIDSARYQIISEDCRNTQFVVLYIFLVLGNEMYVISFMELNVNKLIGCFKVHLHELQESKGKH
jgi:hypothetical protein